MISKNAISFKNYTRRDVFKLSFGGVSAAVTAIAAPVFPALSANMSDDDALANSINHRLAHALHAIGTKKCLDKAHQMLAAPQFKGDLYFHLRDFELSNTNVHLISNTLSALNEDQRARLVSISLSYNTQISDEGIVELAKTLPSSIREIGFVGCGFGNKGALALGDFAKRSSGLRMMCIENNAISADVKSKIVRETEAISGLSLYI